MIWQFVAYFCVGAIGTLLNQLIVVIPLRKRLAEQLKENGRLQLHNPIIAYRPPTDKDVYQYWFEVNKNGKDGSSLNAVEVVHLKLHGIYKKFVLEKK